MAQKKLMAKGQIATYLAEKFEISKKAAACMIDEYAALAIAETKKKGAFVLPGPAKMSITGIRSWRRFSIEKNSFCLYACSYNYPGYRIF